MPPVTRCLAVAAIVALPVLLALPVVGRPIAIDEAIFATIARGMLDGQLLYRDLFDHKPPVIFAWYALNFLLFGESMAPVRLSIAVTLAATALLMFLLIRRLYSDASAYLGAALFAVSTGIRSLVPQAGTDPLMLLPMVGSLLAFVTAMQDGRPRLFLLAGGLGAVATLTKPVAAFTLIALGVFALVWGWREAASFGRLRPALYLAAGAAAALALALVPFVATGTLGDAADANIQFNAAYGSLQSVSDRARSLVRGTALFWFVYPPLSFTAALGLVVLMHRRRWPGDHLVVFWAAAATAGVVTPGWLFLHYFAQLLPAMALLAAAFFEAQRASLDAIRRKPAVLIAGGVLVAVALLPALSPSLYARGSFAERPDWRPELERLGEYLSERTAAEDMIYMYGFIPEIYFYADRLPAARYFVDAHLFIRPAAMKETARTLRADPPEFIVDTSPSGWVRYSRGPDGVAELIRDEYELVEDTGLARIYRLRPLSANGPAGNAEQ